MQNCILIGAGGMGREVLAILKNCNSITPTWNILGFVDDGKQVGEQINNIPVLGGIDYLDTLTQKTAVVIAISLPKVRKEIHQKITNKNIYYPTIKHPTAQISDAEFVQMGEGCILSVNAVLTTNIILGSFVIINTGAILNHDAQIGNYSTIMPGVNISTGAHISEGCYVGTGTKISKPAIISAWENLPAGTIIA